MDDSERVAHVSALEHCRYRFRPWVFADDRDHLFFAKDTAGKRTHHLRDSRARYGAAKETAMRELMAEAGLWAGFRGEPR